MVIREINGAIHVVDTCFYAVRKESKVTLTVDIGDFQAGGTSYTWKGKLVTGTPNFRDQSVNATGPIGDTVMHCLSKVIDIRPETNHTSVTFTLKGGVEERSFPFGVQVLSDNGLANYQVSFVFPVQTS